ncbi:PIG-L family deacetylase [Agromyces atrinae]|uniref:bifunctional PIG-L family deacetylase/class I SAM-dependent methyltransferase n=1 Tax=Agromyces atrinae TaxID=592376 RepID=UPI001F59F3D4|nr:bifunctional PIG-L family deacetylase/class I SAM-dependent methyltransferase [Agromyces atrinae]MCI2957222.1 PIG-L family deacetylase [Agromyces atrinae]
MVSFDHRDPGTREDEWRPLLTSVAVLDDDRFDALDRVVVVAAHPDDETLGVAGLVAKLHREGVHVEIVVATDGERSHPESPTRSPRTLALERRVELLRAIDRVAPGASVEFLGIADGGLSDGADVLHRALSTRLDGARRTLVLAPWRGDGHRDHRIAGEVAAAVSADRSVLFAEYPIWLWHWGSAADVPWAELRAIPVAEADREAKARALDEHTSQTAPLSPAAGDEVMLHAGMLEHFRRDHEYIVAAARAAPASLDPEFFDRFYAGKTDPWGFESRWYEERKRSITLAGLPRRTFRSALEIGCATGVLTASLAERCDHLLAVDAASAPLRAAARRFIGRTDVVLEQRSLPGDWPEGEFDLIVISEVGYYWGDDDLDLAIDRSIGSLTDDGILVACHWRHPVDDYPRSGDDVHARLRDRGDLALLAEHREEDFLLGVYSHPGARSVARETGVIP